MRNPCGTRAEAVWFLYGRTSGIRTDSPLATDHRPSAIHLPTKAMATFDRRFDVRMSPELAEQLNELADQNNMTRAEVFRRAIGLYKVAKSVTNKKGKVLLEGNDQVTRELVGI